jgi:hypothetical protein
VGHMAGDGKTRRTVEEAQRLCLAVYTPRLRHVERSPQRAAERACRRTPRLVERGSPGRAPTPRESHWWGCLTVVEEGPAVEVNEEVRTSGVAEAHLL